MAISQEIHQSSLTKINMKITHLKCHKNVEWANGLRNVSTACVLSVLRNDKNANTVFKTEFSITRNQHVVLALGQEINYQDQAEVLVESLVDHLSLSDAAWQASRETEHGSSNDEVWIRDQYLSMAILHNVKCYIFSWFVFQDYSYMINIFY